MGFRGFLGIFRGRIIGGFGVEGLGSGCGWFWSRGDVYYFFFFIRRWVVCRSVGGGLSLFFFMNKVESDWRRCVYLGLFRGFEGSERLRLALL